MAHEFVHVRQYELNGDAMVGSYLYQSWLARGQDQYREGGNPYEVEAQNVQDHLADQRLDDDIGGFRGWATDFGLSQPWPLNGGADAFYGPSEWEVPRPGVSVYGNDPNAVLPQNHIIGAF